MATTKSTTAKKPAAKKKAGALKDVVTAITDASPAKAGPAVLARDAIIIKPRITEKTANLSAQNVYTFEVAKGATKIDVMRSVKSLFKVSPVKVSIVNQRGKKVPLRTRRGFGVTNTLRKAYVYLKKGDTIDFSA